MGVFSTITSPVFSELVIVFADYVVHFPQNVTLFETLRTMYEARPFKLVALFEILDSSRGEVRWGLVEAMESAVAEGTFDFLDSPPAIRITRARRYRWGRPFDFD